MKYSALDICPLLFTSIWVDKSSFVISVSRGIMSDNTVEILGM